MRTLTQHILWNDLVRWICNIIEINLIMIKQTAVPKFMHYQTTQLCNFNSTKYIRRVMRSYCLPNCVQHYCMRSMKVVMHDCTTYPISWWPVDMHNYLNICRILPMWWPSYCVARCLKAYCIIMFLLQSYIASQPFIVSLNSNSHTIAMRLQTTASNNIQKQFN